MLNDISARANNNLKMLPFLQFDKIYENEAQIKAVGTGQDDGVFINRFVFASQEQSVWMKQYNASNGGYYIPITTLRPNIPYSNYGLLKIGSLTSDKPGIVYGNGQIFDNKKIIDTIFLEFNIQPSQLNYTSFYTEIELLLREYVQDNFDNIENGGMYAVEVKVSSDSGYIDVGYWQIFLNNTNGTVILCVKIG